MLKACVVLNTTPDIKTLDTIRNAPVPSLLNAYPVSKYDIFVPYDMHKGRNFRRNYDPYHSKWMLNPIC